MVKNTRRTVWIERIRKMCVFSMLGTMMFASKIIMEIVPNVHLLGALTMIYTIVYRKQALIPIYIYVFLNGLYAGFAPWWVPYLYVWAVLWGMTMLLPKKMPHVIAFPVYITVCSLHGLIFGILYSPAQALMFGMSFEGTLAWIVGGIPFDVIHAIGNAFAAILIEPLSAVLLKLENQFSVKKRLLKEHKESN